MITISAPLKCTKLRHQVAHGLALDGGQQALLASKEQLQASLTHLLKQWAVLEPALLELQEQRMLAIANSECAVCLDDYSPEASTVIMPSSDKSSSDKSPYSYLLELRSGSRCGRRRRFARAAAAITSTASASSNALRPRCRDIRRDIRRGCLPDSGVTYRTHLPQAHCPICFADKAVCKIVEQRHAREE